MTKQIHDIAVKALNDMKAKGINQNGRARLGSFKDGKDLTKHFAREIHADVLGTDANSLCLRIAFLFITGRAGSLAFRGWTNLVIWLDEVEEGLNHLIEQHKPATEEETTSCQK